jgi:hypothetical protein
LALAGDHADVKKRRMDEVFSEHDVEMAREYLRLLRQIKELSGQYDVSEDGVALAREHLKTLQRIKDLTDELDSHVEQVKEYLATLTAIKQAKDSDVILRLASAQ